jgi:hypothetical protein
MQDENRSEKWLREQHNRNRLVEDFIVASEDMSIQLDNSGSGEDFLLTGRTAWVRIDDYSLHINNHDNRISINLYKLNHESENELEGFNYHKDDMFE